MNIKENLKHALKELSDSFQGIDSNPERIASFPAHAVGCSRTSPLKLVTELKIIPAAWNSDAKLIVAGETCQECNGTIMFS